MSNTTRCTFTSSDVIVGEDWGIEWGTPHGTMIIIGYEFSNYSSRVHNIKCDFKDERKLIIFKNMYQLNKYMKEVTENDIERIIRSNKQ